MKYFSTWGIFASLGFIFFLPFPYFLISFWSDLLKALFNPICEGILATIQPDMRYLGIESDSAGMWIWLGLISVFAASITLIFFRRIKLSKVYNWHYATVAYFLAFILIKYGFDKLLLNQFYFPEPNILHTRVGQMDKSLLYWSSMGSSPVYSIFSGLVEIIPGILLLFRRTRAFAGFIPMLAFTNVLAINIGFNVDVKLLSSVLLFMSIYISFPFLVLIKRLIISPNQFTRMSLKPRVIKDYKWYSGIKVLLIFLLLVEVIGPFTLKSENIYLEELAGTYLVEVYGEDFKQVPKYIHLHSKGYLIVEYYNDFMEDYEMKINADFIQLRKGQEVNELKYVREGDVLVLTSNSENSMLFFRGRKMNNELLPLSQNRFQWVAY